jgi:hypothetical protein
MPENKQAKDELRLKQAVSIMEAVIVTFGEPVILDALAIVVKTPDGQKLLLAAAEASRRSETFSIAE